MKPVNILQNFMIKPLERLLTTLALRRVPGKNNCYISILPIYYSSSSILMKIFSSVIRPTLSKFFFISFTTVKTCFFTSKSANISSEIHSFGRKIFHPHIDEEIKHPSSYFDFTSPIITCPGLNTFVSRAGQPQSRICM